MPQQQLAPPLRCRPGSRPAPGARATGSSSSRVRKPRAAYTRRSTGCRSAPRASAPAGHRASDHRQHCSKLSHQGRGRRKPRHRRRAAADARASRRARRPAASRCATAAARHCCERRRNPVAIELAASALRPGCGAQLARPPARRHPAREPRASSAASAAGAARACSPESRQSVHEQVVGPGYRSAGGRRHARSPGIATGGAAAPEPQRTGRQRRRAPARARLTGCSCSHISISAPSRRSAPAPAPAGSPSRGSAPSHRAGSWLRTAPGLQRRLRPPAAVRAVPWRATTSPSRRTPRAKSAASARCSSPLSSAGRPGCTRTVSSPATKCTGRREPHRLRPRARPRTAARRDGRPAARIAASGGPREFALQPLAPVRRERARSRRARASARARGRRGSAARAASLEARGIEIAEDEDES